MKIYDMKGKPVHELTPWEQFMRDAVYMFQAQDKRIKQLELDVERLEIKLRKQRKRWW